MTRGFVSKYTFCLYELNPSGNGITAVVYEKTLPAGAAWQPTKTGWTCEVSQPDGEMKVRVSDRARFIVSGTLAALPGPGSATQYFEALGVALVGSQGRCFLHRSGERWWKIRKNTPTDYRFRPRSYVND